MPALTTVDSKLDYNQGFEPEEVIERRRESTRLDPVLYFRGLVLVIGWS